MAAITPITSEMSTDTDDLIVWENNQRIDYVGAYDITLAEAEVVTAPQFLKMLVQDRGKNRKFTAVQLGENKFRASIDTGATRTFVGPSFSKLIKEYTANADGTMKVADGSEVALLGCAILKLEANKEDCTLPVRICSTLSYDVVLGMDFIAAMGVEFKGNNCRWKSEYRNSSKYSPCPSG